MSVSFGKPVLAIPGPTTVPDEVLGAMHRPAIDIYAGELIDITNRIHADLKTVFRTREGRTYIYTANGHGAWEAALSNTLSRGQKVLVLESGRFAVGWGEMAAVMGCDVEVLPGRERGAVDVARLEDRLRADASHEIQALLVAQIDTASGVVSDVPAIRAALDAAGHPALLMVDGVASIGCIPFEMDAWGVDLALTGSQKGLMTPPGLSFLAVGPRARARRATADLVTQYWDWDFRDGPIFYQQFCGTPPEHLLFGVGEALDILLRREGLERAWERHALLAEATRRAASVWAEGGVIEFNVLEPSERSDTVSVFRLADGCDPETLRGFASETCGLTLGSGLGELDGKGFRIAHMGHLNAPAMLGTLAATEAALAGLGWAHGSGGAQAAVAYLGACLAERRPAFSAAAE